MPKSKKSSAEAAIPVSYRLQFWTVAVAVSSWVLQLIFWVPTFNFSSPGAFNATYMLPIALSVSLFPLVIFVIAYFTSRRYSVAIGRWFIAVVKTSILIAVWGILHSIWQLIAAVYMDQTSGAHTGPPPAWVMSNIPQYATMAIALVGMLGYIYLFAKKK